LDAHRTIIPIFPKAYFISFILIFLEWIIYPENPQYFQQWWNSRKRD
jgi:hypothetical protein